MSIQWEPPPFESDDNVELLTKDKKHQKYDKYNETEINPKETVLIDGGCSEERRARGIEWSGLVCI